MSNLHDYQSDPFEDSYAKEKAEALASAQQRAVERGGLLVSEYDHYWMPRLGDICPDARYVRGGYETDYGRFDYDIDLRQLGSLSGALLFQPKAGSEIPGALAALRQPWVPAVGYVDMNARTVTVRLPETETEVTFSNVKVGLAPYLLLKEINTGLKGSRAGAWVWRLEADAEAESATRAQHLYEGGAVPQISNAHVTVPVTGYAMSAEGSTRRLVYTGLAGHKTAFESIWASLVSNGRSRPTLLGAFVEPDGPIKLLTQPMPEFGVTHATLTCHTAIPGKWQPGDTSAYALVFAGEADELGAALRRATFTRLQEVLAFPILDDWETVIWERALEAGYVERLTTGGDCLAGVQILLAKPWGELVNGLLEAETLTV